METQNVNVPSNVKVSENLSQEAQKGSVGKTEQGIAPQPRSIAVHTDRNLGARRWLHPRVRF